ncbi:exo-alpha-sialidase [Paenibacillus sp. M1]|uniref:Exo-alpha-sialidase n=1 Tax=Paenibacillus haidiansis TaxID=1574488 RepID=A0ABU7VT02_9BACL
MIPKTGRFLVCLILIVNLFGCSTAIQESPSQPSATPSAENSISNSAKENELISNIEDDSNSYPEPASIPAELSLLFFHTNGSKGWFIYGSQENPDILYSFYSDDEGASWTSEELALSKDLGQKINKENLFVSIPENEDTMLWVMITSDPAMGLMTKQLYNATTDFQSWSLVADVSSTVDGYVTGVTFLDNLEGWITASYHGEVPVPLYRTKDGGKSWELQKIDVPEEYNYGNVYPPVFENKDSKTGSLEIEFVGDKKTQVLEYRTVDSGQSWEENR